MIGNFEPTYPSTSLPLEAINRNKYAQIKSIFLVKPDFSFSSQTLFETQSEWQKAIGEGNIFPIHKVFMIDPLSEDTLYNLSELDFNYFVANGRYMNNYKFIQNLEYKQIIDNYSGQYMKVYYADINGQVYGKLNGNAIEPFDTDLIDIKKFQFGIGQEPSFTNMIIESAGTELDNAVICEVEWDILSVRNIEVYISDFTYPSSTSIKFNVKDAVCNLDIEGLIITDFTINDIHSTVVINTATDNGEGYYTLESTQTIREGTVDILSSEYHGSGNYSNPAESKYFSPNYFDDGFFN